MTQQPPKPPTNPFASAQRPQPPQPAAPAVAPTAAPAAPAAPPATRPASPLSRFGPPRTHWRIVSVAPKLVRFDLNGLGDPFYRMLGRSLRMELGQPSAVVKALEAGGDDVREIAEKLNSSWSGYNFKGALLIYAWRKELPLMFEGRIPTPNENETEETYDDDKCSSPSIWRALDYTLVLNVLARTRANILLPDAPLGLEGQYLNRSLYTDDARLIALALATGCMQESGLK